MGFLVQYVLGIVILLIHVESKIYTSFSLEGNELEQYYHFEQLTKVYGDYIITKGDKCSSMSNADHERMSVCLWQFLEYESKQHSNLTKLWKQKGEQVFQRGEGTISKVAQDCHYETTVGNILYDENKGLLVEIVIAQYNCASKTLIIGGASFYATANNGLFLVTCGVIDLFNNFYKAKCFIPATAGMYERKTPCMSINMSLVYEHFDGYNNDMKFLSASSVHALFTPLIVNRDYCYKALPALPNSNLAPMNVTYSTWNDVDKKIFATGSKYYKGIWVRSQESSSYHYVGDSNRVIATENEFSQCTAKTNLEIAGESHMRFTWDYLAYRYFHAQKTYLNQLEVKHSDISFHHLVFREVFFATNAAKYISSIGCPRDSTIKNVHVVQFGSWDLKYSSLRYVLRNRHFVPSVVQAIIDFTSRKQCSNEPVLVLALPMPYPNCDHRDFYCSKFGTTGSRTNPSVTALSQYLMQQLQAVTASNFFIIDSQNIMGGNLTERAGGVHFLCKHGSKQNYYLQSTLTGEALAAEIVHAACDA